jgi:predicted alpha/beta-hydrolase family hydrolase
VACRTAEAVGAHAVVCLAFPLVTPAGKSRQEELDAVEVPVLVVQGVNDRFGMPEPAARREVVQVEGDHALRKGVAAIGDTVAAWLSARS